MKTTIEQPEAWTVLKAEGENIVHSFYRYNPVADRYELESKKVYPATAGTHLAWTKDVLEDPERYKTFAELIEIDGSRTMGHAITMDWDLLDKHFEISWKNNDVTITARQEPG